ncbi:MAG: hypothetical protein MUF84_00090 [Anaerolineae bacterium]|nr:hypothetical protein [Anaerolineae bacterium]
MRPDLSRRAILIIGVLTAGVLMALALNLSPYLRGPESWRWAYAIPGWPWRHLIPAVVVGGYCLAVTRALQRSPTGPKAAARFLLLTAVSVPLIQAALLFPESPDILRPLFYRTISAGASGVFTVGSRIQALLPSLRDYPALMPTFPVHPQRYPPGLPVLFYLARRAFELAPGLADRVGFTLRLYQCHDLALMRLSNATLATAAIQMALPIVSGLVVFPLYGLAKAVGGKQAAWVAVGLYPLVPSFALWSARWDQAYPLVACLAWCLFVTGLVKDRLWLLFAAGLTLGGGLFLSFGLISMAMPLGITGILWAILRPGDRRLRRLVLRGAVTLSGVVLPWAAYQCIVGNGFADIWRVSMSFHLGLSRDYWTWLLYHPYDFLLFLGLPIAGLFAIGVVRSLRQPREPASILTLAFALSLVVLILSGVARGEVARVWLFLSPFPVIAAACVLAHWPQRRCYLPVIFGLMAMSVLVLNIFLRVVTTGVTDPPHVETQAEAPALAHRSGARFGEDITLIGYDVSDRTLRAGSAFTVTVAWDTLAPLSTSYTVFNHLRSSDGDLVAQIDGLPMGGLAPTTCWRPGQVIVDTVVIEVPERLAPGTYTLVTGLYDYDTGDRLPVVGPGATADGELNLTTVEAPP